MLPVQKNKAIEMRGSGKSIKDIAKTLGVSTSTVSRWCKDIQLTLSQQEILNRHRISAGLTALNPWINKNKELKLADLALQNEKGVADVGTINKRDSFMLGLGLYWGEGYKRGSQELGFTNSDPAMIRFILKWLFDHYEVTQDRIIARVTINQSYKNETERILHYWSKETGIPLQQFSKSTYINGYGKVGLNRDTYFGTLRIKVRRGTSLRRRILASIETLKS